MQLTHSELIMAASWFLRLLIWVDEILIRIAYKLLIWVEQVLIRMAYKK